jgi:hypothetical protein
MWCRSYRDHVIMAFPSFDTATKRWAPQAHISWIVGRERQSHFVRFAKRVPTEAEAATCALRAGQFWVDGRLNHSCSDIALGVSPGHAPHAHGLRGSRSKKQKLTFEQFKSWMNRSGPHSGERELQKSYEALLRLRKLRHRSWADLLAKMRNSQLHTGRSPLRQEAKRPAHLPLTLRDWRRFL